MDELSVVDEDHFSLSDARFRYLRPDSKERTTTEDEILILKQIPFLLQYDQIFAASPNRNVVEMGIAEGGSIIFLAMRHRYHRFVGIDLRKPNPAVQHHLERLGLSERVKLYYGVDQADSERVKSIMDEVFGWEEVGVFMDDASHLYGPSKKTFEACFPRVAQGGHYCLEDWGWSHYPHFQDPSHPWFNEPALANLIYDAAALMKTVPNLIDRIEVTPTVTFIQRGPKQVASIDIVKNLNRGRATGTM